jgi:hypothetical protein
VALGISRAGKSMRDAGTALIENADSLAQGSVSLGQAADLLQANGQVHDLLRGAEGACRAVVPILSDVTSGLDAIARALNEVFSPDAAVE